MSDHSTPTVWAHLVATYQQRFSELSQTALQVRGIWTCEYALRATAQSSALHLKYILVQTDGQGCCHAQASDLLPSVTDALDWRASDLFSADDQSTPPDALAIAALDAIYASLIGAPDVDQIILGTNVSKATRRARVVCDYAIRLLDEPGSPSRPPTILNVGCIGDFLAYLKDRRPDIKLQATDFAPQVVNRRFHGVTVEHGRQTLKLLAAADVAIVTGMTLQTDTLDEVIRVAREHGTRLVMFAETGSNFAEEYCRLGVDVVVSEPFPFYLTARGPSELKIYRRSSSSGTP